MAKYAIDGSSLTAIADAIRAKTGGTENLTPSAMATAISEIESGGGGISGGYTVTFMSDGAQYAISSVTVGQTISEPTTPTKTGATFSGWATAETGEEMLSFPYTPTGDITLYAVFIEGVVLGVIGLDNPSGVLTYTDDIAGVSDYSKSTSGIYVNVSSPLDSQFPFRNIAEFTDIEGNVFVKFPKFYMKWLNASDGTITGYKISNRQIDEDYFIPDAFLDPKDTTGATYLDYFALGKYEASGSTSKLYSKTGQTCLASITRANARKAAREYGSSSNYYNGYQQLDFAQYIAYNLLCMLYFRTANIQTVYGGRTGSGSVSSWSATSVTGTCDGLSGMNGWNTSTDCVRMLGIENPYGNIYKWVDGVYFSSATIYAHRYPQQFADSTSNSVSLGFSRPTKSGFISKLKNGANAPTKSYAYVSELPGGATTYYGDFCYYYSTGVAPAAGGSWDKGSYAGLWCLDGSLAASETFPAYGARLSFRPV